MGTLRGDNGGVTPPEGGGLPGLPPEWGTVVIPDDLTELDDEATAIRRHFRREARRNRWRRRFGRPAVYGGRDEDAPALGLPLLIMSIAIIATLTSLFAIAWPAHVRSSAPTSHPTAPAGALPDLILTDPAGAQFRLRDRLPAVILLVDGCACDALITQTVAATNTTVSVLVVSHTRPATPAGLPSGRQIIVATDPDNALHAAYPTQGVTAILVTAAGAVITVVAPVTGIDDFRGYLSDLG